MGAPPSLFPGSFSYGRGAQEQRIVSPVMCWSFRESTGENTVTPAAVFSFAPVVTGFCNNQNPFDTASVCLKKCILMQLGRFLKSRRESQVPMTHTRSESLQVSGPKCTPNLPLALPLVKETQPLWWAGGFPRACEAVCSVTPGICHCSRILVCKRGLVMDLKCTGGRPWGVIRRLSPCAPAIPHKHKLIKVPLCPYLCPPESEYVTVSR